ncbi:MAG: pyridoxal phosphate-dependent aminotransferase [Deltaproteobacteria bacterium]|nr:pyridoxal phosphate-dependent aminotransferase [Deltaproteobacteria bacterium]
MREKVVKHLNLESPALRQVGFKLAKVNGINLAQGLCLMPAPSAVIEGAEMAMKKGYNIYSAAQGVIELREAIAKRLVSFNRLPVQQENVVVTAGSTGAFEAVCQSFLDKGDEVICFSPFYPYHQNALSRYQVTVKEVELHRPDWHIDFAELEKAFSPRTKFLLLITPNNPTGKVFSRQELEKIGALCKKHGVFCVTDEVYEYITYDGHEHISMASLPGMFEHTITMSSYSKTFAITGWRIGFVAAPAEVADVLRVAFDQLYVCAPTPLQHGVATAIENVGEQYYVSLKKEYRHKREMLLAALSAAGFAPNVPQGAYYILADTSKRYPGMCSQDVVEILINSIQVGAVPATDFIGSKYRNDATRNNFLRFSYAVGDDMLERAAQQLAKL